MVIGAHIVVELLPERVPLVMEHRIVAIEHPLHSQIDTAHDAQRLQHIFLGKGACLTGARQHSADLLIVALVSQPG